MQRTTKFVIVFIVLAVLTAILLWVVAADEDAVQTYGMSQAAAETQPYYGTDDKESMQRATTTTTLPPSTTTTVVPSTTTTIIRTPVTSEVVINNSGVDWYAVAMCESSLGTGAPQWSINTGNGYYGGLQFSHETWIAYGGGKYAPNAHLTSAENQIAIASGMSLSHWPICGKHG